MKNEFVKKLTACALAAVLVTGLAAGILMVINGARLLKSRSELIF